MAGSDAVSPVKTEPVVELLAEEWQAIAELGAELEPSEWDLPSECPGWTVRDLLSHMVGTERSLLGDPSPPDPGPVAHVHNPVGAANEAWVAERRSVPGAEVAAEFGLVTERRLEQLEAMEPSQWDEPGPSPIGMVPYREFMSVRVMDCWLHEQDIRVATGRPGHRSGPVANLALDRIASAMGFVVAKRASAPDGTRARFRLSGSPARRLVVTVSDGRGHVDAEETDAPGTTGVPGQADPDADVTLEMDSEVFWRLGCGRVSGEAALDAGLVGVRGDDELGTRIVRHMTFMI